MSIVIIKPGLFSTIQDEGRKGFQHLGINPNGAMDIRAMQMANTLVLNDVSEAVLEFYFPAPVLQFTQPAFIALGGADFSAETNGTDIPINQPVFIPANTIIQFTSKKYLLLEKSPFVGKSSVFRVRSLVFGRIFIPVEIIEPKTNCQRPKTAPFFFFLREVFRRRRRLCGMDLFFFKF